MNQDYLGEYYNHSYSKSRGLCCAFIASLRVVNLNNQNSANRTGFRSETNIFFVHCQQRYQSRAERIVYLFPILFYV